jgi:hypothetical protein
MPLIDLDIVCASREAFERQTVQQLADAIGRALGSTAGSTWVRRRWLPPRDYAENDVAAPAAFGPVFATVGLAHPPDDVALTEHARALTDAIAQALAIEPDLVHLTYAPPLAGRQAFGGRLVR